MTPETIVTTDALGEFVAEARRAGRVGFDTEFMRERTYRARLCLVQIATAERIALVDTVRAVDPRPIAELIADPDVEVVVHAGVQDFQIFHERYALLPRSIFDVQIAAGFCGYGASLPYGRLVETVVGAKLAKGESYSDWCKRPLTASQQRYAADDVRYLLDIRDRLGARLDSLGRRGWVMEEMRALERAETYAADPDDLWRRVAGRGSLSGRHTAVLREVARWREQEAARRDLPRGWIVKDPTLVEIARRAPRSVDALKQIRGLAAREAERSGRSLLAAVERGLEAEAIPSAPAPPRAVLERARMLAGLADAAVRARCERADIATELVTTRGELEGLLAATITGRVAESDHRLLRGWRRELAGDTVVALARGLIALRAVDRPPYVEEIALDGGVAPGAGPDGGQSPDG